jgi:hypothetical protein
VSAGLFHTCGVTSNGRWICWGNNSYGQSTPTGTPITTTQPSDLSVVVGQSATFSVEASGPQPAQLPVVPQQ